MKIAVIGGSGLIGSKLVKKLREHGHEAVPASPDSGVNTLTGEGLAEALRGASVVVDVSNSPSSEDAAVLKFFETSTRNLLAAEAEARAGHHLALSIVADRNARYFGAELSERALVAGDDARLGETRVEDWLRQTAGQAQNSAPRPSVASATAPTTLGDKKGQS